MASDVTEAVGSYAEGGRGMRKQLWLLNLIAAALMLATGGAPALAAAPDSFTASGLVAVTSISEPIPAGFSGRVRIESETLASFPLTSADAPALSGKALFLQQKSNELFSSPDFTTAVVIDGTAKGTFVVVDPSTGAVVASGQYHLNVSNSPGCQIFDQGHWSTTADRGLLGRGTVTACLNFIPALGTFAGIVTFSGTLN